MNEESARGRRAKAMAEAANARTRTSPTRRWLRRWERAERKERREVGRERQGWGRGQGIRETSGARGYQETLGRR